MNQFLFLLKFSYKNLKRAPRRTLIMIMGLALGTGYTIWDLNFADSGSREVIENYLNQFNGFYHITDPDFYDKKNSKKFNPFKTISDSSFPNSFDDSKSSNRLYAPAFITGEKKSLGILVTGIDVQKEYYLNNLSNLISQGKFFDDQENLQIIIGERLLKKLNLKIGDQVGLIGQAHDGSLANDLYTVVGTVNFGGGELEDSLTFAKIKDLQKFLALEDDRYHMKVGFKSATPPINLGSKVKVTNWEYLLPEVAASVQFLDIFTWIVAIIMILVISLGMSNTLMISFLEREKEFNNLTIIGASSRWILASLCLEVFWLVLISVGLGIFIGHMATWYFSIYPINIQIFTNNKPILIGGMSIEPLIRLYPVYKYYWQAPLMIVSILSLSMIYPLLKIWTRSRRAV